MRDFGGNAVDPGVSSVEFYIEIAYHNSSPLIRRILSLLSRLLSSWLLLLLLLFLLLSTWVGWFHGRCLVYPPLTPLLGLVFVRSVQTCFRIICRVLEPTACVSAPFFVCMCVHAHPCVNVCVCVQVIACCTCVRALPETSLNSKLPNSDHTSGSADLRLRVVDTTTMRTDPERLLSFRPIFSNPRVI